MHLNLWIDHFCSIYWFPSFIQTGCWGINIVHFNKNITNIYNYCIKNTKKTTDTYSTNCLFKRHTGQSSTRKYEKSSPVKYTLLTWHHIKPSSSSYLLQLSLCLYIVVQCFVFRNRTWPAKELKESEWWCMLPLNYKHIRQSIGSHRKNVSWTKKHDKWL